MSTRNIKLGTTTYTGVDTLKVRDADVEDTYIDFKEAGMPMTLTSSYVPVAADVGKFGVSGSGSSEQMYRVAELTNEFDVARIISGDSSSSTSEYGCADNQVVQLSSSIACQISGESGSKYYYFTQDGGATTWNSIYQTTGLDDITQYQSYCTILKFDNKVIIHCHNSYGDYSKKFYYSTDCKNFTAVDLANVSSGWYLLGCTSTSLFFGQSQLGDSVVEYNMSSGVETVRSLPHPSIEYTNSYGVAFGSKFCFIQGQGDYSSRQYQLRITSDFSNWSDLLIYSSYSSEIFNMIPVASTSGTHYVGISIRESSMTFLVYDIDNNQLYTSENFDSDVSMVHSFYVGTNYNFATFLTNSHAGIYYKGGSSYSWTRLVAGADPSYAEAYTYGVGGLQSNLANTGFIFTQTAWTNYPIGDITKCCGIFEHAPYMLKKLSY